MRPASRRAATAALLLLTAAAPVWARAGGSSSGSLGFLGNIIFIVGFPIVLIYVWYVNRQLNAKKAQTAELLQKIARKDAIWEESNLLSVARDTFMKIEQAWCEKDLDTLEKMLMAALFAEWREEIETMRTLGLSNSLDGLRLIDVRIVEVKDYKDNDQDSFTVSMDADAIDVTQDSNGNIVGMRTKSGYMSANTELENRFFREFWTYRRRSNDWLLERVDQSGEWSNIVDTPLVDEG